MEYVYNHDRANKRIDLIRSYLLFKINLSNETNLSNTMLIILQTLYILLLLYVVKSWDLRSECNLPLTKMARNSLLEFFIHEQVNERRLNKWEIEWARTRENAVRRGTARRARNSRGWKNDSCASYRESSSLNRKRMYVVVVIEHCMDFISNFFSWLTFGFYPFLLPDKSVLAHTT